MKTNNSYGDLAKAMMASATPTRNPEVDMIIEDEPVDADKRLCVTVFNDKGVMVQRSYGESPKERQTAHDEHRCGAWCEICYEEACATLNDTIDGGWHND